MSAPAKSTFELQNIVHLCKGNPVNDSLTIAREFGRRHDNVLQSIDNLIKEGTISRLEFKERDYIDERGKNQRMIELTERGALIALPFIGGKKSREGQVRFVDAFLALRDELAAQSSNWADSRKAPSASFKAVMEALKETRTEAGKETLACQYNNEARLINLVLFGVADGVNRSCLSSVDLGTLETIEAKDAYLIARGRSYAELKAALLVFANTVRSKIASQISTAQVRIATITKEAK